MATTGTRMVSGMFKDRSAAERAYQKALDRGYSRDEINLAMSEETRASYGDTAVGEEMGNKALEGSGVGGAIGTVTGGLIGALAAIGTNLVLPGLGLIVAGPLAAGLAGAGAGALTGGLIGALVGWGIPEEHAREYERVIQEGGTLLGVAPRSDAEARALEADFRTCGAARVDCY